MPSPGCKKTALVIGIGCLAVPLTLALIGATLFWWGWSVRQKEGPSHPESASLAIPLEPAVVPGVDLKQGTASPPPAPPPPRPISLSLELTEGKFTVQPGPPGSEIKVEGYFDPKVYDLTQETEEDGDIRRIKIRFKRSKPFFFLFFNHEHNQNRVSITIPEGVPISLDARLARGESHVELGGLTLTDLEADLSMGDQTISFSRPIAGDLDWARFRMGMGDMKVLGLGHAHPRKLDFKGSMGDMRLDLTGDWPSGVEHEAVLRASMGDISVTVPRELKVDAHSTIALGDSRTSELREQPDDPNAPTMNLSMTVSMGGIRVSRR